jgi:hypothetical protein
MAAMFKLIVLILLAFIVLSLATALVHLFRDRGQSTRALKALTVRVGLSIGLIVLLIIGQATGLITLG